MRFIVDDVFDILMVGRSCTQAELAQILGFLEDKIREILKFLEEFDFVRIVDGKARIDTAVKRALENTRG